MTRGGHRIPGANLVPRGAAGPEALRRALAVAVLAAAPSAVAEPAAPPPPADAASARAPDLQPRVEALEEALEELRETAATRRDLDKLVRKPDEREVRTVIAQELELRVSWMSFRQDEVDYRVAALAAVAADPALPDASRAIAGAAAGIAAVLRDNDDAVRPRLLLRLSWEVNRFLDATTYLTASAQPELALFVDPGDVDRYVTAGDYAAPRPRLGFIFKKALVGLQAGRLAIAAGVLQFTYGAGFFVNPTNPFTPKNPLDPRREVDGVPAAKVDLALVQRDALTLGLQGAAIVRPLANDFLGEEDDALALAGMGQLKADTGIASLTAIAITQHPGPFGRQTSAFGGIVSTTPLGLTVSAEALWTEAPEGGDHQPELVVSLQGYTAALLDNGLTYIAEYYHNAHLPTSTAEATTEVVTGLREARSFFVADRLTRALARRSYVNLYLEPALTPKLRVNAAALVGLDEAPGALLRGGLDWELYNFVVHAYGGVLVGGDDSELAHHPIQAFADVAIFARF